jgi:ABC-type transport system involved in cytochrome c biogenesis permease subunit
MTLPDLINGTYEALGGFAICLHIRALRRDKAVRGVNLWALLFFTSWGLWNLWYYPYLGQWVSFAGGIFIVAANAIWVGMVIYYLKK